MSTWLDPLRAALDAAATPTRWWFRDDDGGWADEALLTLLEVFDRHETALDVAMIPEVTTPTLARALVARRADGRLGLHQHGWAHTNHEPVGRKCEFGSSRSYEQQRVDIERGTRRLADLFDGNREMLDPAFTPPWNRCTTDTFRAIKDLGVAVLSRDHTAVPSSVDACTGAAVVEVSVSIDWCAQRGGVRTDAGVIASRLAAAVDRGAPVGVMLHHAVMSDADHSTVDDLLGLLNARADVELHSMMSLARAHAAGNVSGRTAVHAAANIGGRVDG